MRVIIKYHPLYRPMLQTTFRLTLVLTLASNLSACGGGDASLLDSSAPGAQSQDDSFSTEDQTRLNDSVIAQSYVDVYLNMSNSLANTTAIPDFRGASVKSNGLKTIQEVEGTVNGSCGGTLNITGTINDENDYLDISTEVEQYCDYGQTADGTIGITGFPDDFTMSFNPTRFTSTNAAYDLLLDGTVEYESKNYPVLTYISNLSITDYHSASRYRLVYWTERFEVFDSTTELLVSGKLVQDNYGYVDVITVSPIVQTNTGVLTSGQIQLFGYESQAWVTFVGEDYYLLELDYDNDDLIDEVQEVTFEQPFGTESPQGRFSSNR